ncbi:MAG: hypothetical protein ACI8P0_004095, partial [Planctomycetaceae bacterium]
VGNSSRKDARYDEPSICRQYFLIHLICPAGPPLSPIWLPLTNTTTTIFS